MQVVVVANPKGGVGKSTLATQVAAHYACQGRAVALGDCDPQQSARLWLGLRPAAARPIALWNTAGDDLSKPPRDAEYAVLDTPAGLHGKALKEILKRADKVLVPLQPSVFDIFATRAFMDTLVESRQAARLRVGVVAMRADSRTLAAQQLAQFVESTGFELLGCMRNTQNFVHLAAHGLSLFDVAPGRVALDLELWRSVGQWLDAP